MIGSVGCRVEASIVGMRSLANGPNGESRSATRPLPDATHGAGDAVSRHCRLMRSDMHCFVRELTMVDCARQGAAGEPRKQRWMHRLAGRSPGRRCQFAKRAMHQPSRARSVSCCVVPTALTER